jgi:predicted RNA-binding protein with PUA-like domain
MARRYWLFKTEEEVFSVDDLAHAPGQTTRWDGVRNYQARNLLRDDVKAGDGVLLYHSQARPSTVAGFAEVVSAGFPDPTQFEPQSDRYDPNADRENPRWFAVEIRLVRRLNNPIPLDVLRSTPGLENLQLLRRGNRLSIQPVTAQEWKLIAKLAH